MFVIRGEKEAKLYYLYMMSDGKISKKEEIIFKSICENLNVGEDEKKLIIEECKEYDKNSVDILDIIIAERIDEEVGRGLFFGLRNKSSLSRIIWNLINLGYADSVYSNNEKKIVKHFVDKWNIENEIFQEFIDIADTMLALSKQKEWISSTLPRNNESEEKERQIDEQIKQLLEDVEIIISELTM